MNRHRFAIIVLVILGIAGAYILFAPLEVDEDLDPASEGQFSNSVVVQDVKVMLPPTANQAAALYFDVVNRGNENAILSEINVEHGGRAVPVDFTRAVPEDLANLEIAANSSRRFGPEDPLVTFTGYDSSMVPGAEVTVRFRFGNADSVDKVATVEKADVGDQGRFLELSPGSRNVSTASSPDP